MGTLTISVQHVVVLLALFLSANAFSKYGRTCKDIGCLPSEVCAISYDSCSYNQRDGKDCGNYPTCKKSGVVNSQAPGISLNPAPDNTWSRQQPANYPPGPPIDRNHIFGNPNQNAYQPPANVPIFPNSHSVNPQPPPSIYYPLPPNPNPNYYPNGYPPYQQQQPYAFGNQPPQVPVYRTTTKEPSLFHQFLNNKRNSAVQQSPQSIFIYIISAYISFILAIRRSY